MTVEDLCRYAGRADATDDAFVAAIYRGIFSVRNGVLDCNGVTDGQYFRIVGSLYNDGIYKAPANELTDEEFDGAVFALRIPPAFVRLADDITSWQAENGAAATGAFKSESFGGYSYDRGTDPVTGGGVSWQSIFRREINRWRRV